MIQRIQTVWLFLLAAFCIIWTFLFSADTPLITCILKIGSGIVAIAALTTIFLFKKRQIQLTICYGILILLAIICATLLVKEVYLDAALYACSLLIIILTIRAIRKDEKMVRSLDRLR